MTTNESFVLDVIADLMDRCENILEEVQNISKAVVHLKKERDLARQGNRIVRFNGLPAWKAAKVILEEHQRDMNLLDIIKKMLERGYNRHVDPRKIYKNLQINLSKYHSDIFYRNKHRAATFGLCEWEKNNSKKLLDKSQ